MPAACSLPTRSFRSPDTSPPRAPHSWTTRGAPPSRLSACPLNPMYKGCKRPALLALSAYSSRRTPALPPATARRCPLHPSAPRPHRPAERCPWSPTPPAPTQPPHLSPCTQCALSAVPAPAAHRSRPPSFPPALQSSSPPTAAGRFPHGSPSPHPPPPDTAPVARPYRSTPRSSATTLRTQPLPLPAFFSPALQSARAPALARS